MKPHKLIALTISAAAVPPFANAQLEEIIVTAQKRSESLQDVPISISALPSSRLEAMGIEGTDELGMAVPGLQIERRSNAAMLRLRGIGTAATSSGQEPSVAMYVDGVYNPSPNTAVMNFNNVEQIEVLKGPQGTLFGRNATGGVIHVITQDPTHDPALKLSVGKGNYETTEAKLYGSTGVTDAIAADLAVFHKNQDQGYIKNLYTGERDGVEEELALRSKWLIDFSERGQLTLIGSYADSKNNIGMYRQPVKGTRGMFGSEYSGDFYTINNNWTGISRHETWSLSGRVDYEFDNFNFVSITAYQDESDLFFIDSDATAVAHIDAELNLDLETITQEFQITSNNDGPFNWLLGAYFFDSTSSYTPLRLEGGVVPPGLQSIDVYSDINSRSYAVFADGRYNFTEATGLTLGVRYTRDEVELEGRTEFVPATTAYYQDDTTFREPTWRIGMDHRFSDNLMVFGMYSRGYKSGMYDSVVSSGVPNPAVKPEIVDTIELGFKSEWADGLVQVNGAIFQNEAQDLQVFTNVPGGVILSNAAEATIRGIELDTLISPTDQLTLQLGLSLMDSEYDKFPNTQLFPPLPEGGNDPNVFGDVSGNDVTQTPDVSFTSNIDYRIPVNFGELGVNLSYMYRGEFYWEPNNNIKEPALDMVNAELSWTSLDEQYRVKLWGRNLLDEEYSVYTSSSAVGDVYSPGLPLMYGVTFEADLNI